MGNAQSGRPGGNPDLIKYRYTSDEPKNYKVTVRFTDDVAEFLKTLGKGSPEFIRDAVRAKIAADFVGSIPTSQD